MDEEDRFPTGGALDLYASATDGGDGADHPLIGRRLGEYEVTGLIARGGMGVVFSAERADGTFERDVAIKISSGDVMGHDLRDRFLREQAILASLNHPNICQLFDAGVTDEGWPYFVMEKVVGDSVADHCRERQLSPDAICALMIQIVEATAFAHARLVVHRDLKPSNVMVTADGTPKLLDFGIAKLLEVDAEQSTIRPMTPRYASPEQLLGREVTIASDLFQLGALLAELLTGRPLHVDETLETAVERAAQGRSVAVPAPPDSPLPRELRKIVEQCLRPDPDNRYANATALQEDLTRYLQGRPVQAVGLTPLYRLRKFLKRNWVPVTGSLGAGLLIAAGVQLSVALLAAAPCGEPDGRLAGIWDTRTRSAVRSAFAATGFSYAGPLAERAVAVLDAFSDGWRAMHVEACESNRVLGTQSDDLFDRRMMCMEDQLHTLSAVSQRLTGSTLGTLEYVPKMLDSLSGLQRCANVQQLAAAVGPPPASQEAEVTALKQQAASVRVDLAATRFTAAAATMEALRPAASATGYAPLVADVELLAGMILATNSDPAARDAFETALVQAAEARDDLLVAESWIEYGHALMENLGESTSSAQRLAAQAAVTRTGNDQGLRMRLLNLEGGIAFREGDFRVARDRFAAALALAEALELTTAPRIRLNLASAYRELGELQRSRDLAQEALAVLSKQMGADSPGAMGALATLILVHKKRGEHEISASYARQVIDVYQRNLGQGHEKVAQAKRNLAWALKEMGELDQAAVAMQEALAIYQGLENPPSWAMASIHNDLGDLRMYQGQFEASESELKQSFAIWGRDPDSPWVIFPLVNLGFLYNRTDRFPEALEHCSRALDLQRASRGSDNPELAYALSCIGEALLGLGRPAEAFDPLQRSVALRAPLPSYELGWSRLLLARALQLTNQRQRAAQELTAALQVFEQHPPADPHMAAMLVAWRQSPGE